MDKIKLKIKELLQLDISLLKENDASTRILREKNIDVTKYRAYLHEVKAILDKIRKEDLDKTPDNVLWNYKVKLEEINENSLRLKQKLTTYFKPTPESISL